MNKYLFKHFITIEISSRNKAQANKTPLFQLAIDTMLTSATTWKQKQINTPPTTYSNHFRLFHDNNRQQYGYIHYLLFYRTYSIFRRIYIIQQL